MGYSTDFSGHFKLNKKLGPKIHEFLDKFLSSRRMARKLGDEFGVEGEFFAGDSYMDMTGIENRQDSNTPPRTQPSLNCGWEISEDGMNIQWDGGEKFYDYTQWILYIINKILKPNGYILNGVVSFEGEEPTDKGLISIKDNEIYLTKLIEIKHLTIDKVMKYDPSIRQYITDYMEPEKVLIIKED